MRTPADIRAFARKHWDSGRLLADWLAGAERYPLAVNLAPPTARQLLADFAGVRDWIAELETAEKSGNTPGYRLETRQRQMRKLGAQNLPTRAWLDSRADCLALAGRTDDFEAFAAQVDATLARLPALLEWMRTKPLAALAAHADWERLLTVCEWFLAHPRPGVYPRALDIPGIDTKFIETQQGPLGELLERVLPDAAITSSPPPAPRHRFAHRFGLRIEPPAVRLRLLDPALRRHFHGLSDLALTLPEFRQLDPRCDMVFITENKANGLAFPDVPDSLVIFGLGHGLGVLRDIPWLADKHIFYWGDIDSHGFAMLARMRGYYPQTESLLMDETLLARYRELAVEEPAAASTEVAAEHLTPAERDTFTALREHRYGHRLRLEQERIPFGELQAALAAIAASPRRR